MSKALVIAGALFLAGFVHAQTSGLSGPVQGFTFDLPTRTIRPVIGFLGSASLGQALVLELDSGFVAPKQTYAIAIRHGQVLFISGLGSSHVSEAKLEGVSSVPDALVWSDDGSTAALYSQTGGWIQVYSGFPNSIEAGAQMSITSFGGLLSAIAVDAHGQHIAIGFSGNQPGIFEAAGGGSFSLVMGMAKPIALAYAADDGTLYALDGSLNQVWAFSATSSAQSWMLDAEDAVAIRPALDAANRKVLYVAGRSSQMLLVYDRSTHQLSASMPLSFNPAIIDPFGLNGFLLTHRSGGTDPLWSFTNGAQPTVYFVPGPPVPEPRREVRK